MSGEFADVMSRLFGHASDQLPPAGPVGEWCGQCDPGNIGGRGANYVTLPDGRLQRCPRCYPRRPADS
jgi:hypothetical protein